MSNEPLVLHPRFPRFLAWYTIACFFVSLTSLPVIEPWTNWNVLYFLSESLILMGAVVRISKLEDFYARLIASCRRFYSD